MCCVTLNQIDPSYMICIPSSMAFVHITPPCPRLFLSAMTRFLEKGKFSDRLCCLVLWENCLRCSKILRIRRKILWNEFCPFHEIKICIVYRDHPSFKQSIICIWTALTMRTETLAIIKWSKEARSWTEICTCRACMSPRRHHFVHPWSVRWQPIRFERMSTVFITDCVHTPGACTRTSPRWCESIHPRVTLVASTPSHLLRTRRRHHDDHWSKEQISGGGNFFGTMRKKICPWRWCQTV